MLADIKSVFAKDYVAKLICLTIGLWVTGSFIMGIINNLSYDNLQRDVLKNVASVVPLRQREAKPNAMLQTPLLGEYVPKNLSDGHVKRSMLNVTVVGVMFSTHEADSQVIIRVASGREQMFRVGDSVSGGAVIKRITPEGVLVLHNGELESLSLPRNELIFASPPKSLGISTSL